MAIACVLSLSALAAAMGWGYYRGSEDSYEKIFAEPERAVTIWQRELISQRQFLNSVRRDLEADLSAFSVSMGKMQGYLARLDATAERILAANKIDPEEFTFGEPVPLGGPGDTPTSAPQWRDLFANLNGLEEEIERRETRLHVLEAYLQDQQATAELEPGGRPLEGGWISSSYGYRTDPVTGRREFHGGVDFAGKPGLEVKAVADGVVTWSGKRWGYGNLVELSHGNGYVTRYAHNRANLVALGEKVEKDQPIALLGSSGRATGPHVHFEVMQNDRSINPWKFINRN